MSEEMRGFDVQAYEELVTENSPVTEENLFIVLGKVQDIFGGVPREIVRDLAVRTGLAEARIYGALTSYRDFKVQAEGRD